MREYRTISLSQVEQYLRQGRGQFAEQEERLWVTDQGRTIAELRPSPAVPPFMRDVPEGVKELIRRGYARAPLEPADYGRFQRQTETNRSGHAQELLDAEREDRSSS